MTDYSSSRGLTLTASLLEPTKMMIIVRTDRQPRHITKLPFFQLSNRKKKKKKGSVFPFLIAKPTKTQNSPQGLLSVCRTLVIVAMHDSQPLISVGANEAWLIDHQTPMHKPNAHDPISRRPSKCRSSEPRSRYSIQSHAAASINYRPKKHR